MYFDILDKKRQEIVPHLGLFKDEGFYLAGGTSLALQLGHRDSFDFDYFKKESFDTLRLFEKVRHFLPECDLRKVQDEEDTLSIMINDSVKLSFFAYDYPMIKPLINTEYLNLASLEDIACMKLASITHRSTIKDYIDLYFLMKKFTITELLILSHQKFNNLLDTNLILKSLVYFEDITDEHIAETMKFCHHKNVTFAKVKTSIQKKVNRYIAKKLKI